LTTGLNGLRPRDLELPSILTLLYAPTGRKGGSYLHGYCEGRLHSIRGFAPLVKCRIKRVDRSGGAGFAAHQREAALLLRLNRPAFEPKGLALFQLVSRWAFDMTDPHVELAWLHWWPFSVTGDWHNHFPSAMEATRGSATRRVI
jgi:hypothetical protein